MNRRGKGGPWICLMAQLITVLAMPVAAAASPGEPETSPVPPRRFLADAPADTAGRWTPAPAPSRQKWGLIGAGTGLVAGVAMAIWVKSEADDHYEIYLNTADPEESRRAFDSAERYDRATLIGWGLAQVSFVAFIYFLTREKDRPLVPLKGEPLVRSQEDGLQVGFRFTP